MRPFAFAVLALLSIATPTIASIGCQPENFHPPAVKGLQILNIDANEVDNHTRFSLAPGTSPADGKLYTINFCNITVTYEHPGWNDEVHVNIWLPLSGWNGRMLAVGGGGYSASYGFVYLAQGVGKGFACIATDSGHDASVLRQNSLNWTLFSSGNLNLPLVEDWGYKTLGELSTFGKAITSEYYGRDPGFTYFDGCSGGGRQAMALAQRFPSAFDGILAAAPAMCKSDTVKTVDSRRA